MYINTHTHITHTRTDIAHTRTYTHRHTHTYHGTIQMTLHTYTAKLSNGINRAHACNTVTVIVIQYQD